MIVDRPRAAPPRAAPPRPSVPPHSHKWDPVGIVYVPANPDDRLLQLTIPAVAQSCPCGAVQAVIVPGALR